jgi:hypothetical protein
MVRIIIIKRMCTLCIGSTGREVGILRAEVLMIGEEPGSMVKGKPMIHPLEWEHQLDKVELAQRQLRLVRRVAASRIALITNNKPRDGLSLNPDLWSHAIHEECMTHSDFLSIAEAVTITYGATLGNILRAIPDGLVL